MFVGVQFNEEDGGGIGVVNSTWLTPRKKQVFWPPYKQTQRYNKAVKTSEEPSEGDWQLCGVSRIFFSTDTFEKACQKIKKAEETSDLQTDADELSETPAKRKVIKPQRLISDIEETADELSEVESDENHSPPLRNRKLARPPRFDASCTQIGNDSSSPSSFSFNSEIIKKRGENYNNSCIVNDTSSGTSTPNSRSSTCYSETRQSNKKSFEEVILSTLCKIEQQNSQIINWINKQGNLLPEAHFEFPVQFPINHFEQLNILENFLIEKKNLSNVSDYLSRLGGRDVSSKCNKILKHVLTNTFAKQYSFYGSRLNKKAFAELNLKLVVIKAVQKTTQGTEEEINSCIKNWLKHAPQRELNEEKRKTKDRNLE